MKVSLSINVSRLLKLNNFPVFQIEDRCFPFCTEMGHFVLSQLREPLFDNIVP